MSVEIDDWDFRGASVHLTDGDSFNHAKVKYHPSGMVTIQVSAQNPEKYLSVPREKIEEVSREYYNP